MSARNSIAMVVVVFILACLVAASLGVYTAGTPSDVAIGIYAGIVLACVVIGALIAHMLHKACVRPLQNLESKLSNMAAGNLHQTFRSGLSGEWGRINTSLGTLQANLNNTFKGVGVGLAEIVQRSDLIVQNNVDLGSRTDELVAGLQQTAQSMQQLSGTVTQNAEHARQADALASRASDVAQRGGQIMYEVISTMGGISANSRKVSEFVAVIDSIAFQTNILALNAAVEAARAGEQGKGFAVVASEVRSLASRSAQAAREVKSLIDQASSEVVAGHQLVEQAGRTMGDIVDSITKVTGIMGEIAGASKEQAIGIDQINRAVLHMDEVMHQNAGQVQNTSGAAVELKEKATEVAGALTRLRVGQQTESLTEREMKPMNVVRTPVAQVRSSRPNAPDQMSDKTSAKTASKTAANTPPPATVPPKRLSSPQLMSPVTGHRANLAEWESF